MKFHRKILIILLIALLFRLFIIFYLPTRAVDSTIKRYHFTAVNLIEGRGYSHLEDPPYQPSLLKPPTYSIFTAVIYKIFGVNVNAVKIVQALLDTLGCLLLFFLLGHYFDKRLAFFGLILAAFCPMTAVYVSLVNPENLTMFLLILSLWLVSKSVRSQNWWFFFAAGLSTILMGYSRPEFISFVFIFGAYLFVCQIKKDLRKVLLYVLAVVMIMTPWIMRNYNITGRFIPLCVAGGAGITFWHGTTGDVNNDRASFKKFFTDNPELKRKYDQWNETVLFSRSSPEEKAKVDRMFLKMAIQYVRENPLEYVIMRIKRMPRVWINLNADEYAFINTQKLRLLHPDLRKIAEYAKDDPKEVFILGIKYLLFIINIFYLCMALKGLWGVRRRLLSFSLIILPLAYAQAFFFFMLIAASYAIVYWPCIIFFSAAGLYSISRGNFKIREQT